MRAYGEVDAYIRICLTSTLVGVEWSPTRPGRFTPRGKSPRYPLNRSLGGPQSRSGRFLIPPGLEPRPLGHLSRTQLL
jgi:hypothetical protein